MIKYILNIINSKRDINGNCYWAFEYTDTETGHSVHGQTGSAGDSNINGLVFERHGENWEPRDTYTTRQELPIREFNRLVKNWEFAGSDPKKLAEYVTERLSAQVNLTVD